MVLMPGAAFTCTVTFAVRVPQLYVMVSGTRTSNELARLMLTCVSVTLPMLLSLMSPTGSV